MSASTTITRGIGGRRTPQHSVVSTDTAASVALADAIALLCEGEAALAAALAVPHADIADVRRGVRAPSVAMALALVHVLRERAARLQLTAEALVEATQSDVALIANGAWERAMREPDKACAVETALQALFDLCG